MQQFHLCIYDVRNHWFSIFFFSLFCAANSSPKIFGPNRKRIEGLSIVEQNELKGAAWFQAGIPREISLEVLSRQSPGAFLVRQSSTKPGCFALSLRVPPPAPKVAHYLILRTSRGYKIKVNEKPNSWFILFRFIAFANRFSTGLTIGNHFLFFYRVSQKSFRHFEHSSRITVWCLSCCRFHSTCHDHRILYQGVDIWTILIRMVHWPISGKWCPTWMYDLRYSIRTTTIRWGSWIASQSWIQ